MKYAVIKKVTERTGPTMTSFAGKVIDTGQVIDFSDIIETENETWGRVAHVERKYVSISIGDDVFCAPLQPLPNPEWAKELDLWARIQGYKGARP